MRKLLVLVSIFYFLLLNFEFVQGQVPSYVPTNGLVAYYPFNGNANDASGNGNNGVVNGATLTSDRFGINSKAFSFNGVSNNIIVPHSSNLNLTSYTVCAWVKFSSFTNTFNEILTKGGDLNENYEIQVYGDFYNRVIDAPTMRCTDGNRIPNPLIYPTYTQFSNRSLSPDSWYFIVNTFDASTGEGNSFLNDIRQLTYNTSGRIPNYNSTPLYIGQDPSVGRNCLGIIDDIAIYNRALTQSEITSLYNSNSCIANITNSDTSICRGSSITLNAAAVSPASVTDINGNVYPSVNIGTQTWMQKNLNVSKYKNGDIIPQVTNPTQWAALTTGAWCWYNNDSATYAATYGKLYNWYAVNDPRGLAPEGWHVPSDGEWNKLVKNIDSNSDTTTPFGYQSLIAGGNMKEAGVIHWLSPNTGANNSSNFTALPGSYIDASGAFGRISVLGYWWSSSQYNTPDAWYRILSYNDAGLNRLNNSKISGFSVRCLKNTPITYLWSTGATTPSISVSPTVTTKYYCTVSDGVNTCKDSVTVTVSTITTNFITADTIKVCGTSTTISATTGLASYAWSNGANTASTTITNSGWYKCTATNGACTAVDSVYVSLFNPKITQIDTTVCAGTALTLTVNNNTALTSSLPANLRNGLVGYWPFNGNANDESGNGNNGTVNGATTLINDRFGNNNSAFYLNGSSYINCGSSNTLNCSSGVTVSFWGKTSNLYTNCGAVGKWNNNGLNGQEQYVLWFTPNQVAAAVRSDNFQTGAYAYGNFNYNDNQWHKYTITYDGAYSRIFIDAALFAQHAQTGIIPIQTQSLTIGQYAIGLNNERWVGTIDDIAIYNRALSGTEIQQLYSLNSTTYLWSTTATTQSITVNPTATTSYIATVSNGINTCKDTVKITVATINNNFITADTIKVCGTSTTISATTGLASYAWSNGANTASTTVTSSGWYKCTATNGACTAIDSVYVSLFNPKITQNDTTVCAGTALTLTVNNNTALTSSLPANLRNGLVGYWPFNGNANDESGNGNNGTVNGATLTTDRFGNVGKAYSFNGIDNRIWRETTNQFPIGSNSRTISVWVKITGPFNILNLGSNVNGIGSAVEFGKFGNTNRFGLLITRNYELYCVSNSNDNNSFFVVPRSTWHHLVLVANGNQCSYYLDSSFLGSRTLNQNLNTIAGRFSFGNTINDPEANQQNEAFNGSLDDIAIYNRALSGTEIQQLYSLNSTTYLWSTTATTPSITVSPTATTSYIATVSNGINTCKDTVKITVANITSLAPTTIFGAVDVCASIGADTASVPVNYKINKVANAASYVWTVPAGATLLSGQGDTSIMVRFSASFVSGAITVKSVSTCNISSAVKSVTVYKRVAATPTAIQKEFTPTSIVAVTNVTGSASQIYRIKKVLYATSYNWFLNRGTNATITHVNPSGENDTAVIVTFASCFVKDTLSVKSVTPCSISAAKTVIMSSSTTPATVAGITTVGGDFVVCTGTSKTFTAIASTPTTTQVGIARYRWTNPLNTVITSATSDSSSITVSFNAGFTGGNLTCKGISACGVVGTTASTAILQYLPPTPLSIGSSTNSYNACINSSVTYTALLVSAPTTAQATATVFRWTKPNNTTITSASADSSSITVRFNTGYTGGVISVKGQSRCGTQSAARSQTLTHTGCALGTKTSLPITTTNKSSFEVSLYPNPTTNEFKLLIKNNTVVGSNIPTKAIVKVIDLQGRMMKSFITNTNQVTAIGNELKSGVYMVEVRLGDEVKVLRAVKLPASPLGD